MTGAVVRSRSISQTPTFAMAAMECADGVTPTRATGGGAHGNRRLVRHEPSALSRTPTRVLRKQRWAWIALAVPVLLWGVAARATTIDAVDIDWLRSHSDLIVRGHVSDVAVLGHGPDGRPGIHSSATVRVSETLYGAQSSVVTVWVPGGRLGRRARVVHGQATFQVGEDVVMFLHRHSGALWPTGMIFGKWHVAGSQVLAPLGSSPSPLAALRRAVAIR